MAPTIISSYPSLFTSPAAHTEIPKRPLFPLRVKPVLVGSKLEDKER